MTLCLTILLGPACRSGCVAYEHRPWLHICKYEPRCCNRDAEWQPKGQRHHWVSSRRMKQADIGLFNICMGFQDQFWPKMRVLWGKIGEGVVRYWPLTNSFFLLGVRTSVPILVKIDQEMRPWECSQTDRQIHWQMQTDFIICPMLYAIAMGQIKSYYRSFSIVGL